MNTRSTRITTTTPAVTGILAIATLALVGCGSSPGATAMTGDGGAGGAGGAGNDATGGNDASAGTDGGGHAQYASLAACNAYCTTQAAWTAGTSGDMSGNTVGCRLYHATAAASDPATHCPHAGPTGGNVCGSWCENYCQLMAKNCTGANAVYDAATCMTKCQTIPTSGMPNDAAGNTVQCRIYHLGAPAATDPAMHCPHSKTAADNPAGPCT